MSGRRASSWTDWRPIFGRSYIKTRVQMAERQRCLLICQNMLICAAIQPAGRHARGDEVAALRFARRSAPRISFRSTMARSALGSTPTVRTTSPRSGGRNTSNSLAALDFKITSATCSAVMEAPAKADAVTIKIYEWVGGGPAVSRSLEIEMGKGPPPKGPDIYDAHVVAQTLGPHAKAALAEPLCLNRRGAA